MVEDAIATLIEADELVSTFPEEQRRAWRALVSGLVGIAEAVGESHRQVTAAIGRTSGEAVHRRSLGQPASRGME